jgi:ribosomal protein S6 kinase alpha-5
MSSSGDQQQQNLQNAVVELRQFDLLSVLGVGGYGKVVQVRKAVGNDEGSIYAMKVLKKSAVTNSEKELGHITAEKTVLQADKVRNSLHSIYMYMGFLRSLHVFI